MALLFSTTSNHIKIEDFFWLPIHSWYLTTWLSPGTDTQGTLQGSEGKKLGTEHLINAAVSVKRWSLLPCRFIA